MDPPVGPPALLLPVVISELDDPTGVGALHAGVAEHAETAGIVQLEEEQVEIRGLRGEVRDVTSGNF